MTDNKPHHGTDDPKHVVPTLPNLKQVGTFLELAGKKRNGAIAVIGTGMAIIAGIIYSGDADLMESAPIVSIGVAIVALILYVLANNDEITAGQILQGQKHSASQEKRYLGGR